VSPERIAALVELLRAEYQDWLWLEVKALLTTGVEETVRFPRPCPIEGYTESVHPSPTTAPRDRPWQHAEAVVEILTSAPHPLTMPEILSELRRQRVDCSVRTLARWLPRMVADGAIRHVPGQGYGMPLS